MKKSSVVLLLFLTGCTKLEMAHIAQSWENQCFSSLPKMVSDIAGENAIDCGLLRLGSENYMKNKITRCAKKANDSGLPFKFGYTSIGYDSKYCHIALKGQNNQLWSIFFDFDVTGQFRNDGGSSSLNISKCQTIEFKAGTIGPGSFFDLDGCEAVENSQ